MRSMLLREFRSRQKKNPSYSLRAFARSLGLPPSTLSRVLSGERSLPSSSATAIQKKLLGSSEVTIPKQRDGKDALTRARFKFLQKAKFERIRDWQHYAILELTRLRDFVPSANWIAQRLGIQPKVAEEALDRLRVLEMIGTDPSVDHTNCISGTITVDSSAHREYQRQVLELATNALTAVPLGSRDQSSMTIALDQALFNEAVERITKFRRDLYDELQSRSAHCDAVYQLSVSFFPLTQVAQTQSRKS